MHKNKPFKRFWLKIVRRFLVTACGVASMKISSGCVANKHFKPCL